MGRPKLELIPGIEEEQPAEESSNIIWLTDYKSESLSRAVGAVTRIDSNISKARIESKKVEAPRRELAKRIIDGKGSWPGNSEPLSNVNREELLCQAVEDPDMPDVWHQEALERLDKLRGGVDYGQA